MKLNKLIREQIVSAILSDIPKVDYIEQMRVYLQKDAREQLPEELKEAIKKNPDVASYIETESIYPFRCTSGIHGFRVLNNNYKYDTSDGSELKRIHDEFEKQRDSRNEIRIKIESVISGCRTTEEFLSIFPEFEQYTPRHEESSIKNLPACKVIEEMKAAGWVKKEQTK